MRYVVTCLYCAADITSTDHVRTDDVAAVEAHLRMNHPEKLTTVHPDFAEVLGHVRMMMAD
jgi:hypothetical protein